MRRALFFIIILFLSPLLIPLTTQQAPPYIIEGDTVYIDDSNVYLSATPHTIGSSGWVEFQLISKRYGGAVDIAFGFKGEELKVKQPQVWKNYSHDVYRWVPCNSSSYETFYDITFYENLGIENFDGYTVDYGNEFNTQLFRVNATNEDENTGSWIVAFYDFAPKPVDPNEMTVYYNYTSKIKEWYQKWYYDWKPFKSKTRVERFTYKNIKVWYLANQSIQQDKLYKLRVYVQVPFEGLNEVEGKYYFGVKPHHETVQEAYDKGHLYFLDPWYHVDWGYRRQLTFDNSRSTEDLTDFTVYVHLNDSNTDWTHIQNNGEDIRFTDSDEITLLNFEIEQWNDTNTADMWVKVPQVDSGSATDSIYMYYGNAGASDGQNVADTWDDNFILVQHLNEVTGNVTVDSTQYDNDGDVPNSLEQENWVTGKLNNALYFDGVNDNIAEFDTDIDVDYITVEFWINLSANDGLNMICGTRYYGAGNDRGFDIFHHGASNYLRFQLSVDGTLTNSTLVSEYSITENIWLHVVTIFNGTHTLMYVNNILEDTDACPITGTLYDNNKPFYIGRVDAVTEFGEFTLDDLRIYDRPINTTEITHSYNSGNGDEPLNTTGLHGRWKLDESRGGVVYDSSGNDYTGQLTGYPPEPVTGIIDSAMDFHGENIIVEMADAPEFDFSNVTFEGWVYLDTGFGDDGEDTRIMSRHGGGSGVDSFFQFRIEDSRIIKIRLYNGSAWNSNAGNNILATGSFHYVVCTWNGSHMTIYLNGAFDDTNQEPHTPHFGDAPIIIGAKFDGVQDFNGTIDEARISNVTRSGEWVEAQYYSMNNDYITFGAEIEVTFYYIIFYFGVGINQLSINGSNTVNGTTTLYEESTVLNFSSSLNTDYLFFKYDGNVTSNSVDNPFYLTVTGEEQVWAYAVHGDPAGRGFVLSGIFILALIIIPLTGFFIVVKHK